MHRSASLLFAAICALLCALVSCAHTARANSERLEFADLGGSVHAPLDFEASEARASVFIFITTDCPIANAYAPEIRRITEKYRGEGLRFFLVHVDPDLVIEDARAHMRDYSLDCAPILIDREHRLVRALGVRFTPEAAVLRDGGEIFYRGRIDDLFAELGKKRRGAHVHDLRDALSASERGESRPRAFTQAIGCNVPSLNED